MKSVVQKDSFGCGVACVSYILNIDYNQAKKLFINNYRSKNKGFLCKDIVKALSKKGLKYQYKYLKPKIRKLIYNDKVIVFIKRCKKYPSGHYLCRDIKKGWMDSWINFPSDIKKAKSGFRKKLPGQPIYIIFPKK